MTSHRFMIWDTDERPGRWLVIPFAVRRFKFSPHGWEEPSDPHTEFHAMRYNDLGTRVSSEPVSPARVVGQRTPLGMLPDPVARALREEFS